MNLMISDNGGMRSGIERRKITYFLHAPERRAEKERRNDLDRRNGEGCKLEYSKERRMMFKKINAGLIFFSEIY